jgi:hypothetical protein
MDTKKTMEHTKKSHTIPRFTVSRTSVFYSLGKVQLSAMGRRDLYNVRNGYSIVINPISWDITDITTTIMVMLPYN